MTLEILFVQKSKKNITGLKYMYNEDKASGKVKEKQRNTPRLIKMISFLKGNIWQAQSNSFEKESR